MRAAQLSPTDAGLVGQAGLDALRLESDTRYVRTACGVLLIPTLWFSLSDASLSQGDGNLLTVRLLLRCLLIGALVMGMYLVPRSHTRKEYEQRLLGMTLLSAECILALNALRHPDAGVPLRTPLVWLFALYAGFPSRPSRQFIAPLVLTGGLLLLPGFWDARSSAESISGNLLVLLTMNAVGVLLVYRRQELAERQSLWGRDTEARILAETSLRELKALRGIIPICSHCKKVRTEVGDWEQVEAYVQAHSDAHFSHGICPSCMTRHYPQLDDNR